MMRPQRGSGLCSMHGSDGKCTEEGRMEHFQDAEWAVQDAWGWGELH